MISKLICYFKGHRRGKRVEKTDVIACPRCKSTWTRKVKA